MTIIKSDNTSSSLKSEYRLLGRTSILDSFNIFILAIYMKIVFIPLIKRWFRRNVTGKQGPIAQLVRAWC